MTITEQRHRFEDSIRQAERLMETNPRLYRVKLAALAVLGYAVLFGMLLLLLGIVAVAVWAAIAGHVWWVLVKTKLVFVLLVIVYVITRALWVQMSDPIGYELTSHQYPRLFVEADVLRQQVKAPRIHRIVLTNDFNAGIAQVPRLGVFGWPRNTLIVGLQLLLGLPPEEARAVLAHEMGHLSGRHGRFSGWIYRVRLSWYRIMSAFSQTQHWAARILARFFEWYAPYFNAYSFALARTNEYQADMIAAELTTRHTIATALVNTGVRPIVNDRYYWKPLLARMDREPIAPTDPMSGLEQFETSDRSNSSAWAEAFGQVMAQETGYADTHPSLRDRLRALAENPLPMSRSSSKTAAHEWLGANLQKVLRDFDQMWLKENSAGWKQRYEQVAEMRKQLEGLRAKPEDLLTKEESWNLAAWTEAFDPTADPLPLYRKFNEVYPQERATDLAIGRLLLQRDDPGGLTYLDKIASDAGLGVLASQVAYTYALRIGDTLLAKKWRLRGEQQVDLQVAIQRECQSLPTRQDLIPTALGEEPMARLCSRLANVKGAMGVWICERRLRSAPTQRAFLLAAEPTSRLMNEKELLTSLCRAAELPGQTFAVSNRGNTKPLAQLIIDVGTKVF